MRRILTIAVLLTLLLASNAQAGWKIDRAEAIADTIWHRPCGDRPVDLVWEQLPPDVTETVHHDERPPYAVCRVRFDVNERLGWIDFCSYMIHAYGHLATFQDPLNRGPGWADIEHSHKADSIMAEFFDSDSRCAHRGRPYLEAHGLLAHGEEHLRHALGGI